jgi:dolichyl-phosphate beta-glucosyltransferase
MLAARGAFRFICDADLSMPIEFVTRFFPPQSPAVAIAIASREAPGASRHNEPALRHLIGRAFNLLVRLIAIPGSRTRSTAKCFTPPRRKTCSASSGSTDGPSMWKSCTSGSGAATE